MITKNPDIFPGFFHIDLAGNVLPKLALLRQFRFYPKSIGMLKWPERSDKIG